MGRPLKLERQEIIDRAMNLFWQQGYGATTLDDLDIATGLNRGSLYHQFGGKRDLFMACLDAYGRDEIGAAISIVNSSTSGAEAIRTLFMGAVDAATKHKDRRGCLLCNTAVEMAPHDKEIEKTVTSHLSHLRDAFANALAIDAPEAPRNKTSKAADHLLASYAGLLVMAKSGFPAASLRRAAEAAIATTLPLER